MDAAMTCLIVGGGSGIGKAAAQLIARNMPVLIADLNVAAAQQTATQIRRAGGVAIGVGCDVRRIEDCEATVAKAETLGRLTDLVISAGVLPAGDGALGDCATSAWELALAINLTGAANTVRAALPALGRASGGDIVLVSSAAALRGRPGVAAYTVSKAGLLGLQHALVADYAASGVRCNCVCPGPTATPMARPPAAALPNAQNRQAEPEEIAAAIAWLTAPESDWVIGAVLALDGGENAAIARSFLRRQAPGPC
jgi:NAD(P)-dependent dehydrogenase (short-subunit alcohol dehydrogenase family)